MGLRLGLPQFIFQALKNLRVNEFDGSAAKSVNLFARNQSAESRVPIPDIAVDRIVHEDILDTPFRIFPAFLCDASKAIVW